MIPDRGMHWETNNGLTMDASHTRQRLQAYLTQMVALHPEQEHPDMVFVDALIEDRAVVRDHDTALHELQMDHWPSLRRTLTWRRLRLLLGVLPSPWSPGS